MPTPIAEFAATRSPEAFRRIVQAHADAVYAQCLRRLDDPAAAEDATQAVFVTLAQRAGSLAPDTVLAAWLYVAAQNVCLNARRSAARRSHHERKAAAMRDEVNDSPADAQAIWRDVRAVLDDAIAALGGGLRDAIVLRFLQGWSMAEIGRALNISEDAAKQRVSRAVKALREQLAGRGVSVPAVLLPGLLESFAGPAALPAALIEATVGHAMAAPAVPVATTGATATMAKVAAAAVILVGGTVAVVSSVALVGSTTRSANAANVATTYPSGATPPPGTNARVVLGRSVAATTMPGFIPMPAELIGTWRLTTPDELVPRDDGKRLRLMPVVIDEQEIQIEARGLDAGGPSNRRIELRPIAAKLDGEWRGLDLVVTDMTRDGAPQEGTVGTIVPATYRIDAEGLLHLRIEQPELVLRRDEPTTQPAQP